MQTSMCFVKKPTPWRDRRAKYKILIDGTKRGTVALDHTVTISVDPGSHSVQLRDWWASSRKETFTVNEGDTLILECGPIGNTLTAVFQGIFTPHRCMYLKGVDQDETR